MTPTFVLLGVLALLIGVIYWYQARLIFLPDVLAADHQFEFPFASRTRVEEVEIPVEGATLNALRFCAAAPPRGVVFYLHGNAGSLQDWGWVAPHFLAYGFDVFILDYRGYGKSTGQVASEKQLLDDVTAAYEVVRQKYDDRQIVVYGRSIGTGPAVWVGRQHTPRMVILESPYYSLRETARRQFYNLLPGALCRFELPTYAWISDLKCPTYLIHGTQDELIAADASQRLEPLIKADHRLFLIEGGHHNDLSEYEGYAEALERIFRDRLESR